MRGLKAAKAEKAVVDGAVAELLDLKKRLAEAEKSKVPPVAPVTDKAVVPSTSANLESLTKQVAEQV